MLVVLVTTGLRDGIIRLHAFSSGLRACVLDNQIFDCKFAEQAVKRRYNYCGRVGFGFVKLLHIANLGGSVSAAWV